MSEKKKRGSSSILKFLIWKMKKNQMKITENKRKMKLFFSFFRIKTMISSALSFLFWLIIRSISTTTTKMLIAFQLVTEMKKPNGSSIKNNEIFFLIIHSY